MFTYCLMKQQLVYLLWASVFKVSSSLFMGHIETSLLCVTCILVTARGLSQQLLFALDCQMNGCSQGACLLAHSNSTLSRLPLLLQPGTFLMLNKI